MNYRMDSRTKEQFIRDIEKGNERERLAITLFRIYASREFGYTGEIKENGVDMSGKFIEDDKQVTTGADYVVGKARLPLEVKTSAGHCLDIYIKKNQVDSYIQQGAYLLYVQGITGDFPAFTIWSPEDLKEWRRTLTPVVPPNNINGGKLSYKIDATEYEWRTFGGKVKKYVRR